MKRKLIISVSVLIALIAVYIAVTKLPGKKVEEEPRSVPLLNGFEIISLDVENSHGKYALTYEAPDWMMDGEKADGGHIVRLSRMRGEPQPDPNDPAVFGLDPPAAKATLKSGDGKTVILLIGDETPDKTGRYVMTDGIYVVLEEYVGWLIEDRYIHKNKVILGETSPKRIEFNGIRFELTDAGWRMTSPYDHSLKGQEFNTGVLESLEFIAADFTDKAPAECGLEPPKGYVTVWNTAGEKTTVYFGDKSDGLIYASREGSGEIARVNIPDFLDKNAIYYLNTLCYVKNIDEIESIEVNGILFKISEKGYTKNGKPLEKETFIEFYKKLMGMTLIGEAADPSKDDPILEMKVNFKSGASDLVEVCRYKERYGAVFINGKCEFYVLGGSAEEIALEAQKL